VDTACTTITGIVSTWIAIVTALGNMHATCFVAEVIGAGTAVIAIHRRMRAIRPIAGVVGTWVVVVAIY
jgi:hypothetical protein